MAETFKHFMAFFKSYLKKKGYKICFKEVQN